MITMGAVTITVLVDNLAPEPLVPEYGFAALVASDAGEILFDTGQLDALVRNADVLGIDLKRPRMLVLSHGHYDHTGGLAELFKINPELTVFFHPGLSSGHYSCHPGKPVRNISMPEPSRRIFEAIPAARRRETIAPCELLPGIKITGEIPRLTAFEDPGGPFFCEFECCSADSIPDDLSLWIETPAGLVILAGCCHAGLVNTVETIRQASGIDRVRGIIGGLHLLNASPERLAATIAAIRAWKLEFLIPCHCTGENAVELMRAELGDIVQPGHADLSITV